MFIKPEVKEEVSERKCELSTYLNITFNTLAYFVTLIVDLTQDEEEAMPPLNSSSGYSKPVRPEIHEVIFLTTIALLSSLLCRIVPQTWTLIAGIVMAAKLFKGL
ncbi:MAG: hypothetical protein ACHQT8_07530 [Chlamydiales bacterium]